MFWQIVNKEERYKYFKILVITLKLSADNNKQPQPKEDMIVKLQERIKQLETEKKDLEIFWEKYKSND